MWCSISVALKDYEQIYIVVFKYVVKGWFPINFIYFIRPMFNSAKLFTVILHVSESVYEMLGNASPISCRFIITLIQHRHAYFSIGGSRGWT